MEVHTLGIIRQMSKTYLHAQEQYSLYCSHSHQMTSYGFGLLCFSSINMDGAAGDWSAAAGPSGRQILRASNHTLFYFLGRDKNTFTFLFAFWY